MIGVVATIFLVCFVVTIGIALAGYAINSVPRYEGSIEVWPGKKNTATKWTCNTGIIAVVDFKAREIIDAAIAENKLSLDVVIAACVPESKILTTKEAIQAGESIYVKLGTASQTYASKLENILRVPICALEPKTERNLIWTAVSASLGPEAHMLVSTNTHLFHRGGHINTDEASAADIAAVVETMKESAGPLAVGGVCCEWVPRPLLSSEAWRIKASTLGQIAASQGDNKNTETIIMRRCLEILGDRDVLVGSA